MSTLKKPNGSPSISHPTGPSGVPDPWSLEHHWPALIAGLADQVTQGIAALQTSIDLLAAKERIGKLEYRALSVPAERIKQAGIAAQQIHRFYAGRIRQSHEKVGLAELIENLLQERRKEFGLLGIELRRKLKPVEVLMDPTVAYAFVNAALDWALPFGQRIDVRLDVNTWPQHGRLQVRASNNGTPPSSAAVADGLSWMLLRQIAQASGGIEIESETTEDGVSLTTYFTRTVQAVDGIAAVDLSDDHTSMFKSLQGVHALTISPTLQIRADVRDALREIGIASDSVVDFDQAKSAVHHRMPSLIVFDAELRGPEFDQFQREVLREAFELPFVEISPDDSAFDMSGFDEMSMAKVGRGNIRDALGTAVMFELAKMM